SAIDLGAGGAGFNAGAGAPTGSENVVLTVNAPVGSVIEADANVDGAGDGAFGIVANWNFGTLPSGQTADSLLLNGGAPVIIANTAPGVFITSPLADGSFYQISGGVISLGSGSPVPSAAQELKDAQLIVDNTGVIGEIGIVQVNVSSGAGTVPATF